MTIFSDTISEAIHYSLSSPSALGTQISVNALFGQGTLNAAKRYNESDSFGIGMNLADTEVIRPGRIISEAINLQPSIVGSLKYSWTVSERVFVAQALALAIPASVNDAVNVHPVLSVAAAVTVLQGLGLTDSPLPTLKYTWSLIEQLAISPTLTYFLGGSISDVIDMAPVVSVQLRANPAISDAINLHDALSNKLILSVTASDVIDIDQADAALSMIFSGEIDEGIMVTAGYVSPSGNFTAWAINTRNTAVTEYQNYAFNSFARIGDQYFGANDSGLYLLAGDTDNGTSIISTIRSCLAEWGGSRFSVLKAAYLAARGGGNWVLKVITNTGIEYIYAVNASDAATTRIRTGKGIRTRYFSFELISTGQDFTLDTLEFVPIISERRV